MNKYTMKVYTGPVAVKEIAELVRDKGYKVEAGTEHVYFEVEAEDMFYAKTKASQLCFNNSYRNVFRSGISILKVNGSIF